MLPCSSDPNLWFAEEPAELERAKALCGACPVRRACLAAALERMCKGLPFVLCNAPLVEDPATWTLESLTKQLRNRACSVLSCPAASHTFTVFRSGRQHEAYEAASDVSVELMGFDDFAEVARRQREGHFDG